MDLQAKLINDGYAQGYLSPEKPALPATAVWKNMGYGVTAEPVFVDMPLSGGTGAAHP
jgi:iron(III) transport system substrate-binding protein